MLKFKNWRFLVLVRMQNWTHTLLMGMQNGTATLENKVKHTHTHTIQPRKLVPKYVTKQKDSLVPSLEYSQQLR